MLLMPLPLVWLLSVAMSGPGASARMTLPPGRTLVPMLSREERMRLTTYEHDCRTDADCDPQLRCAYDVPTSRYHCTDSLCTEDERCPEGFTCIPIAGPALHAQRQSAHSGSYLDGMPAGLWHEQTTLPGGNSLLPFSMPQVV